MAFTVERIDHVEVFVRDLDRAVRWYRDALGLNEIMRWDPHPVMIGAADTKVALFLATEERDGAGELGRFPHWRRVAWLTTRDGFEEARGHLADLGVEYDGPFDHDVSWSIYFNDPDGNPLEITYYKDG